MQTTKTAIPNLTTSLISSVRTSWRRSRRARSTLTSRRRASALAPIALAGLLILAASYTAGMSPERTAGRPSDAPLTPAHAATFSLSSAVVLADAADQADQADQVDQQAHGVSLHYQRGYSVQGSWLCYGWPSGMYHCTQHWYRASSGAYVSRHPGWVPSEASPARQASEASGVVTAQPVAFSTAGPANISQWAYTGQAAYGEPSGGTQGYSWGWCTAGAAQLAHDYVGGLGNALDWTRNAAARGMATGTTPRAGATVVYAPGVQGASGGGHVAHVAAVYGNGWFLSEDVNFFWNGGGWGRVSFRYAHTGAGVTFIY